MASVKARTAPANKLREAIDGHASSSVSGKLAFANDKDSPPSLAEQSTISFIAATIFLDLLSPESSVGSWRSVDTAVVAVPKATVHEYNRSMPWKD